MSVVLTGVREPSKQRHLTIFQEACIWHSVLAVLGVCWSMLLQSRMGPRCCIAMYQRLIPMPVSGYNRCHVAMPVPCCNAGAMLQCTALAARVHSQLWSHSQGTTCIHGCA
jgi:hypothetical protein